SGSLSAPTAGTGGGIYSTGALTITTSTISGNSTGVANASDGNGGHGGGVFINFGSLVMINSTVSSNTTGEGGSGQNSQDGVGGGIYISEANVTTNVKNSILANNYRDVGPIIPDDCFASSNNKLYSSGYNLIAVVDVDGNGVDDCAVDENIRGTAHEDPKLLPLANNGGETPTHALPPGSPAIDQGSCEIKTKDQRGRPRPVNTPPFDGDPENGCDIGAYEAQPELALTKIAYPTNPDRGDVVTYTITVVNTGILSATNVNITDNMNPNLTHFGSVTSEPDNLSGVGDPPSILTDLDILPDMRIIFTYTAIINDDVPSGDTIENTATATCDEYVESELLMVIDTTTTDTANISVGPFMNYLPIIVQTH
ncbi:MAG: isopeptide-forming domain-containing fimbrial protein, partial [Planctomycetes bacterium]|nr:isopeptide-forming domain-containing fimbrial protein [Planctomycetota bacterium]